MRIKIDGFEKIIGHGTISAPTHKDGFRILIVNAFLRGDTPHLDYNFLVDKFTEENGKEEFRAYLERKGPYLTIMNMNATKTSPRILLSGHHYKKPSNFISTMFRLIQLVK